MRDDRSTSHAGGTPHIGARRGDVAATVIMPGDPLRARWIAEARLANPRPFNVLRNMLGFTGELDGVPISVMGSGIGGPSMGLYAYELFDVFGVERIVRAGTCGGLRPELAVGDVVFAVSASTDSSYAQQYGLAGTFSPCADFGMLEAGVAAARRRGARFTAGHVLSSDLYSRYAAFDAEGRWRRWARMGCLASEMETYALYCTAAYLGKRALSVLTCASSQVAGAELGAEERERGLVAMLEIALEVGTAPA